MKKSTLLRLAIFFLCFFLFENAKAQLAIDNFTTGCVGQPVTITAYGSNGPFVWDLGNGMLLTTTTSNLTTTVSVEGTYQITITDSQGLMAWGILEITQCSGIIGNLQPCLGDCSDYFSQNSNPNAFYSWEISDFNGNTFFQTNEAVMYYCWTQPGEYQITLFIEDTTGTFTSNEIVIVGNIGQPTDIVSLTNTFCQIDSLTSSSCEKICANSSAIYTVPGGQNVTWEVLGADSYEANGNQVEVQWGAPGNGSVTASSANAGTSNLLVNCWKMSDIQVQGGNGIPIFAEIYGGTPPYTFQWTTTDGNIVTGENTLSPLISAQGVYSILVTSANGESASCELVVFEVDVCSLGGFEPGITHESGCDFCDGSIALATSGNVSYLWSNGSTTTSQTGLCSGTYGLTITDDFGCSVVNSFTIGCPSSSSSCATESTICIDILEDPDAAISTIPAAVNGVVSICEGQTVFFNNESAGATIFEWSFGNGDVSSSMNTEQTYPTAGTFEAYLIARNDCYCSDTTFVTIEVEDAISPFIDCVGTICEATTVTYSTDADCGNFTWTVTGDFTITDGGGAADNFVTIEWLTGPEGTIELSVSGCTGNYCVAPTIETIPIISDDAKIKGPDKVCKEDEAIYFIDDYDATDFTWTVSAGGNILEGWNTNRIKVKWNGFISPNAQQWVAVDYQNCYLGCGGSDQLDVYILPQLYIEGDLDICENEMSTHFAKKDITGPNAVSCNWTVTNANGAVVWNSPSATNSVTLDWNSISSGNGRYAIQAIPDAPYEVCDAHFTSYVNVVQPPPTVSSVDGNTQICPGLFYSYEANSLQPDNQFKWIINDGGNISTNEGKAINVSWGNVPPYILSVTQISTSGLACESDAIDLTVFPLPAFLVGGDGNVCEETSGFYQTINFDGVPYEWNIIPADAGTILSGQSTNNIEVFWHQPGNAVVEVTICGNTESTPVTVIAKPEPVIDAPVELCPGEVATVSTTLPFDSYLWKTDFGSTITNTATTTLPAGTYELVVTNSFGCENNISFTIDGLPEPEVNISVPGTKVLCFAGGDPPVEIHATEVPAGYTYEWYFNNALLPGATGSIITTSDYGSYSVIVTDENGCTASSNVVTLFEDCNFGGGVCNNPGLPLLPCQQGTDVTFTFASAGACDVIDFTNTSPNAQAGTFAWDFEDVASGNSTSLFENPSHKFSNVGYYIVTLEATNGAGQACWDAQLVEVPISAKFKAGSGCVGSSTAFEDLSGYLPGHSIASWSWNFDDPTSGVNNTSTDQHPLHIYDAPGNYDVSLTITHTSGCTSNFIETVTINPLPTATIDDPAFNCQGTALNFTAQTSNNIISYDWNFDDAVSGAANTSETSSPWHAFDAPGNYDVTLVVTDIYGCTISTTNTINVEPNNLNGNVSFSTPSPICDGDVTTLTAPSGGVTWVWSDGSMTENITTGEAGVYTVTMTDAKGCEYISPAAKLDVIPLPTAAIQAVEFNEFGQPVNTSYTGYATCEGEDVQLQVVDNANYSYTWSDGTAGHELIYSEERNNLLVAGTYDISLDILDLTTGCSNTVGPFTVIIHPTPTDIIISSSPTAPICENTLTTLTVDNPDATLTYVWNTGEIGTSIQVLAGGEYFVRGISTFGCSGESNKLLINPAPDIKKIPNGCHSRCNPDTICLPTMNGIVNYQWYLDGSMIPGPAGNIGDLIATQSGNYHVVMTDTYGCTAESDILTLDLYDGYGTLDGNVYFDVNQNGIIDAPDTLVSGIEIILLNGGTAISTVTSGTTGGYMFPNILSTNYDLQIDPNTLPPGIVAIDNQLSATLVGCDDQESIDWLLTCATSNSVMDETICFGETFIFNGTPVPAGTPTDFVLTNMAGCDSIVTITVTELPDYDTVTQLSACDGDDVTYNGVVLSAGSTTDFSLVSAEGCDYIETVEVVPFPASSTNLQMEVCEGETVDYNGQALSIGTEMPFVFQNQFGCDSIVMVSVTAFPEIQFDLTSDEVCWNGTDGSIEIDNLSGTAPFEFSLDGNTFQPLPVFENLNPSEYTVFVKDANGCESEASIQISTIPPLEVNLVAPLLPCDGGNVFLQPELLSGDATSVAYEWNDGTTFPQISTNEPGTYTVATSNICETIVSAATVSFEDESRASYLYIPNAFSPNGDGMNDMFQISPAGDVALQSFDLYIFDRWGNQLFDTHSVEQGWDGTLNSKVLNSGVYVYYVRANITSCGRTFEWFQKGDVTIVR